MIIQLIKAYYIAEQTPLVGWLKPWMLPGSIYIDSKAHESSKENETTAYCTKNSPFLTIYLTKSSDSKKLYLRVPHSWP
jgi:hypothetical protein